MSTASGTPTPRAARGGRDDSGFSLVEVIVAIALISAVMGSLSLAFIRTMKAVNMNQDRQESVVLANQQMEFVRSLPSTQSILEGRTEDDVTLLEAEGRSFAFTSDVTSWDRLPPTAVDGPDDDLVPLRRTVISGSTSFLVRTFIRSCWRSDNDTRCTDPLLRPDRLLLYRVYVAVSWVPVGKEECTGWTDATGNRHCEYLVSALLEPNVNGDRLYR